MVAVVHEGHTPEFGGEAHTGLQQRFEAGAGRDGLRSVSRHPRARPARQSNGDRRRRRAEARCSPNNEGRVKCSSTGISRQARRERNPAGSASRKRWAGTGFGAAFLPARGTEVVVTSSTATPIDRSSSAPSQRTHPAPFGLPQQRTKSGFRTQSTPGGQGGSELSSDEQGQETLLIKAKRKLNLEVGFDTRDGDRQLVVRVEVKSRRNVNGSHTTT